MSFYAYHPDWPHHEAIQEQATRWQRRGLLTAGQLAAAQARFPLDFYRPHLFLRIGLFLFTTLGALAGAGFVGMMFQFNFLGTLIVSLIIGAVVLEMAIRGKRLYHSGADNALLYLELLGLVVLIFYFTYETLSSYPSPDPTPGTARLTVALLLTQAVLLLATLRYADRLVAVAAYLNGLLLLGNVLLLLPHGTLLLPFALCAASAAAYLWFTRQLQRPERLYYHRCLGLLRGLALGTAYLAVNYWAVREGNMALMAPEYHSYAFVAPQIPLAWLFCLLTATIPLFYLVQGLRRPDRTWLWLGLLTAAFSVFTLRYYRSLLPAETAATLAGAFFVALAVWATRYLHSARHGLTSAPDDAEDPQLDLESLVVAQTAHSAPAAATAGVQFGGGHSGGGGATGAY
ncbi:hypothetical protein [Hymenobacter jeollabukensis]|uniref:DUF2157 domain-containing protein n=1 Tax=Hymenobacter jeollabukensis TaxID=2025313 RepID=A0A5R8WUN2_9BACT|nr:hypothetical protein [Hymenobacter jeollabukensis]TLM95479.1 hypothetical protein FDY95_06745 [Hymenobacter jeollabukensis]